MYVTINWLLQNVMIYSCSIFDSNSAPDAAAINLVYYNAVIKNVTFVNHTGSTLRVSDRQLLLSLYITLPHTCTHILR